MTITRIFPHPDSWHLIINKRKTPAPECLVLVVYNKQTLSLYTYGADGVKSFKEKLRVLSIGSPVAGFVCCRYNKPNQTELISPGLINRAMQSGSQVTLRKAGDRTQGHGWLIYRPGRHGLGLQERRGH